MTSKYPTEDDLIQVYKLGRYFNPASESYGVSCDRCKRENLSSCISYTNFDLCMQCVTDIENNIVSSSKPNVDIVDTSNHLSANAIIPNKNAIIQSANVTITTHMQISDLRLPDYKDTNLTKSNNGMDYLVKKFKKTTTKSKKNDDNSSYKNVSVTLMRSSSNCLLM